jgi:hypothetical protein
VVLVLPVAYLHVWGHLSPCLLGSLLPMAVACFSSESRKAVRNDSDAASQSPMCSYKLCFHFHLILGI